MGEAFLNDTSATAFVTHKAPRLDTPATTKTKMEVRDDLVKQCSGYILTRTSLKSHHSKKLPLVSHFVPKVILRALTFRKLAPEP